MLQGCATGHRRGQRPGRLPEAQDPLRAGRQQRQRPVGRVGQRDHQAGLQGQRLGDPRHHRRRQQPHRHPRRPEGRNPHDEHRRHRPHVHRDQHPLGHRASSATTASRSYLLVDYMYRKLDVQADRHHPGQQPLRPLRRPRDPRLEPPARTARSPSRWPTRSGRRTSRCRSDRLKAANVDAVVHWGDAVEGALILNQMREHGHEAAVLRLRPLRLRRVRQARRARTPRA